MNMEKHETAIHVANIVLGHFLNALAPNDAFPQIHCYNNHSLPANVRWILVILFPALAL